MSPCLELGNSELTLLYTDFKSIKVRTFKSHRQSLTRGGGADINEKIGRVTNTFRK